MQHGATHVDVNMYKSLLSINRKHRRHKLDFEMLTCRTSYTIMYTYMKKRVHGNSSKNSDIAWRMRITRNTSSAISMIKSNKKRIFTTTKKKHAEEEEKNQRNEDLVWVEWCCSAFNVTLLIGMRYNQPFMICRIT